MGKTSEFVQKIWIKAQLDMPLSLRHAVVPRLHEAKEIARLMFRPCLPVYQMQGQGQGGPLTVTYIGLDYAKPFLKSILFPGGAAEQPVGRVFWGRCGEVVDLSPSDIVIVEGTRHLIRTLPRQDALVLPQFVYHILDVRGDWQDVKSRFRKSVRHELRLTRKHGYQYEVSYDDRDFETFYRRMYLPTMKLRHGALASPMSFNRAYQHFRHGLLFFVKRDGQRVCGSVCYLDDDTVHFMILGVLDGSQELMREGAVGALYCLRVQWANERGYKAVNFLGSDPFPGDSLFRFKRKWGTAVSVPPHLHRQIWIGIRRNTPAVARFLKENPFIVVDGDGDLHGHIVVDDSRDVTPETVEEWEKRYVTPGMSDLLIRSVGSFAAESADGRGPDLVIPISAGATLGDGDSG